MIPVPYKVRGDHQICIPYKVWGTIRFIDIILYIWGDHIIAIPYKVWGTISHIRHEDTSHMRGPYIHVGTI